MRPQKDIEHTLDAYGSTIWRVCVLYFKNNADAEDAFQDTLIKYSLADEADFCTDEHKKAWLIRVATNTCKDMLKASHRSNASLDSTLLVERLVSDDAESQPASSMGEVIDAMQALPDPPRTPLYLSLYEGYSAAEIAEIVDAPVNTVYSWIARGKALLKEALS